MELHQIDDNLMYPGFDIVANFEKPNFIALLVQKYY